MFEHLDDPRPFTPDDELRVAVARRGRRLQGRARLRTALVSVSAIVLIVVLGVGGYLRWQVTRIDRVSIAAIPQVDAQGNPVAPNVGALDRPFTMLVIGNDDAPDVSGRSETNLADSIMLIRVDRPSGSVRVVSIPRDTLVTYPDGSQDRINAARRQGIPALITAINRTFGVTVDHYAEAHFDGFAKVIDTIGGVPLVVDRPMRDAYTGLHLRSGCQVLDGTQALALVRSRHLEVQDPSGRWVTDPSSDLGRVARQQVLGVAAAKQAARRSAGGAVGGLDSLIGTDPSQITLDDHLGLRDLLDLSEWVGALPDDHIVPLTLAVDGAVLADGRAVLVLPDGAAASVRDFLLDPVGGTGSGGSTTVPSIPTAGSPASVPPTPVPAPGNPSLSDQPIHVPDGGTCG